jgi:ornithine carbamoyltransferase
MIRHFINLADFTGPQLAGLIDRTIAEKPAYRPGPGPAPLTRQTLAMVFEKASLRTRVSFEVAMTQLGGTSMYLDNAAIGIGKREAVKDIARVLGRMCDGIMARTYSHDLVVELAAWADVPVINALSDYSHPCQAMADLVTAQEHFGSLEGRTLTFIGDGNNVARSLAVACARLGMRFVLACPPDYALEDELFNTLSAEHPEADLLLMHDPQLAVRDADVIYTDTWVSMGQEAERARRQETFAAFQVNSALMKQAPDSCIVLHCLPAYRGSEITEEVFEANAQHIFDQAENRLHFQRTLLGVLLGEGNIA